ncbi:gag-pol, partial [Mucuna pruriens]
MLLLQEFDIEIRDKSGPENPVANRLSKIEGRIDLLPIRDDFLDEQLMQLDCIVPWFADIRHLDHIRIKLRVMLNIMCGMIHICGNFVVSKYFVGVYWTMRSSQCSRFVSIMDHIKQLGRYWIAGFIGPPFSRLSTTSLPHGIDFIGPFPVSYGYAYILLTIDYVSKWVEVKAIKTNDAKVVMDFVRSNIFYRFRVPKALISDQESHFYNKTMSTLLEKYGVVHRVATTYHPQTNGQANVIMRLLSCAVREVRKVKEFCSFGDVFDTLEFGEFLSDLEDICPLFSIVFYYILFSIVFYHVFYDDGHGRLGFVFYANLFLLCMTRSNPDDFHAYDPEIDRTFHSSFVSNSTSSACASDPTNNVDFDFDLGNFGSSSSSGSSFDSNLVLVYSNLVWIICITMIGP